MLRHDETTHQPGRTRGFPGNASSRQVRIKLALVRPQLGAKKLGYNITVVQPGKRAFPFHNHYANEEMFFTIAGEGLLRFGNAEFSIREGDIIACPPAGPDKAHQIINTGTRELGYLAVSRTIDTDSFNTLIRASLVL